MTSLFADTLLDSIPLHHQPSPLPRGYSAHPSHSKNDRNCIHSSYANHPLRFSCISS